MLILDSIESYCSEAGVADIFYALKIVFAILQVVIPVVLIVSVIISLIGLMSHPDDPKKKKGIITKVGAALIVVTIPFIVNIVMSMLESRDVEVYNIANCWTSAEETHKALVAMRNDTTDINQNTIRVTCVPLAYIKNENDEYDYATTCESDPKDGKWYQCLKEESCYGGKKGTGLSEYVRRLLDNGYYNGGKGAYSDLGTTITTGMPIPHYSQCAHPVYRHGESNNLCGAACGPTSLAMIESYLMDKTITVQDIAAYPDIHKYFGSGGSDGHGLSFEFAAAHNLIPAIRTKNGRRSTTDINEVVEALEKGHPIMYITSSTLFTRIGHILVLRGATKDGKILINDPSEAYHSYKKGYETREFTKEEMSRPAWEAIIFPTRREAQSQMVKKGN